MKTSYSFPTFLIRTTVYTAVLFFCLVLVNLSAQSFCSVVKPHGNTGYATSIESVTLNVDNTFTIVLRGEHNGCDDPACKVLNHYSIEADEGTYSNINVVNVFGSMSYNGINLGPNLGGTPFNGFRVANITGIGNGQAGVFHVIYTLTYLQDQQVQVKAAGLNEIVVFSMDEFQAVLDCSLGGAYAMPPGGKINDVTNKIGPELTALSNIIGVPLTNDVYEIVYDPTGIFYVVVEFVSETGQYNTLLNELQTNHGLREFSGDNQSVITGQLPVGELAFLNDIPSLFSARPVYPVHTNVGLITSQGDTSMISHIARGIFSENIQNNRRFINGEGVKIGVISNSYNTQANPPNPANDDVLKFDLPGVGTQPDGSTIDNPYNNTPVVNLKEYPYGEASDEGRAMMQIIHDVAPGADLYFRTGVLGAVDMANGIDELVAAGCDLIVDDVTYIAQPFFEDGMLAQKVDEVNNAGISYFTSAGNFGSRSCSASFNPGSASLNGVTGSPHIFGLDNNGNEDYYQSITADVSNTSNPPAHYTIVLQWEDGSSYDATNTDLDIYLCNAEGNGLIGYNTVNTGGRAIEVLPFVVTETTDANIVIVKASDNTANITFKYVVFRGQLSINEFDAGHATIVGHANASGAMTVGAIRYDKTPAYGGTLNIMSYSSVGGVQVNGADRNKPDFTAPNGVNTSVDLGNGDWDHTTDPEADIDLFPNFFGTSAAAPHAAAVAALLLDAKSSYYGEAMTPADVRANLISTAEGSGTYDAVYGNGFIQADKALWELGNPAPILDSIVLISGGTPGLDMVTISVSGSYFTTATKLYFKGLEITNTTVNLNNGILEAEIPPFTELYPPITAYNPPKGTNETDGGMSNAIYFTEKPTIYGTLTDATKTYGEDMPPNNIIYSVVSLDGTVQTLEGAGLDQASIDRINSIDIFNNASALANAGSWQYYVDPHDWLNPLYVDPDPVVPQTDLEIDLLANFNFAFSMGMLEITKIDLTITPDDHSIVYGEPIAGITYTFSYDSTYISQGNNEIIQNELIAAYNGDVMTEVTAVLDDASFMADSSGGLVPNSYFMSEDAYAALNGQALAMVNGKALAMVNGQALAMVNGQALAMVNGQALAMVNGQALAMVNLGALVNGQALAMVNTDPDNLTNGLALAMVNTQALAMVNNPDPQWSDPAYLNGLALAMVNTGALTNGLALAMVNQGGGLVNGQALAMVNSTTFSELTNEEAILLLTVDDVRTMMDANATQTIELFSVNTVSGITATAIDPPLDPHKIAPGAFVASNFNVQYDLGNVTVDPTPVSFSFTGLSQTYNGGPLAVTIDHITYFSTNTPPLNTNDYVVEYEVGGIWTDVPPTNANTYNVRVRFINPNYITDPNGTSSALFTINPAPVSFAFSDAEVIYNGIGQSITVAPVAGVGTTYLDDLTYDIEYEILGVWTNSLPVHAGTYPVSITNLSSNYVLAPNGTSTAFFVILQAPVSFSFTNNMVTYNGSGQAITVDAVAGSGTTYMGDLTYELTYEISGAWTSSLPVDAGTYPVSVTNISANYILDNNGTSTASFLINQAPVGFSFSNGIVTYNGSGQAIMVDAVAGPGTTYMGDLTYDVSYEISGVWTSSLPSDAGTYPVSVTNISANYILDTNGTSTASFLISPAAVSFSFTNDNVTFNGSGQAITVDAVAGSGTTYMGDLTYDIVYEISGVWTSSLPVDAGTYPVSVTNISANYVLAPNGTSTASFLINQAPVGFSFSNNMVTYNGSGQAIMVDAVAGAGTTYMGDLTYDVSYEISGVWTSSLPSDAGTYPVSVTNISANYVLDLNGTSTASFLINPAAVDFSFGNIMSSYNGSGQAVSVIVVAGAGTTYMGDLTYDVAYEISGVWTSSLPSDAGSYPVSVTNLSSNYMLLPNGTSSAVFTIQKVDLLVSGDNQVINEGQPAPAFSFTFSGFVNNETAMDVFGPNGPVYTTGYNPGSSGPGEYVISMGDPSNYLLVFPVPISLFVNPDAPGTKAIVPKLDCVTDDGNGIYTAYFLYENKNNDPVWVLIGADNIVTGGGADRDISDQPIKFEPGGGSWVATFDGSQMTWEVSSQDHGHKSANGQSASSNSRNCTKSGAANIGDDENEEVVLYPNPATSRLSVTVSGSGVIKEVAILSMYGKEMTVPAHRKSGNNIELEINGLANGVYLVRTQLENKVKLFKVIKK